MIEKKWHQKTFGKIIQVLIWPLGLYMMFKFQYFSKTTRYIIVGILLLLVINRLFINKNGIGGAGINQRACDCSDILILHRSAVPGVENGLKWDNCKNQFGGFSYANEQCVKSKR